MSIYDFQVHAINGTPVNMSVYRGKVLLIVNTASRCSYSRQFPELQKLYVKHRERGFEVLAFPCNQFNGKEPGSDAEVREYCGTSFGVTFALFGKTEVRGPNAHPLFPFLTERAPFRGFDAGSPEGLRMSVFLQEKYPELYAGDEIKWNFTKFVIDRSGEVRGRYETTTPVAEIEPELEPLLKPFETGRAF
ncbi:glutathione peroxidase [Cohnella hongkongensis]|uniref:Glutathione peroxidase n=1 Tax=Cohnella hongkongensis TaxID=178337 RepID=A0ABV9FHI6_9BACL